MSATARSTPALLLTAGTPGVTKAAITELADVAVRELRTQGDLSAKAIQSGSTAAAERVITEAWRDYYVAALTKILDMAVNAVGFDAAIAAAQERVRRRHSGGARSAGLPRGPSD
ncbi:MAG: hypothetical protein IPP90_05960 [Gemmatimonadaceae bacterium]|nr:hypothetical protein [Gemmatimonadaceae bacterium]